MEITYQTVNLKDLATNQIVSLQNIVDKQVDRVSLKKLKHELAPMLLLHSAKYERQWGKTSDEFNRLEKDLVMKTFHEIYLKNIKGDWLYNEPK